MKDFDFGHVGCWVPFNAGHCPGAPSGHSDFMSVAVIVFGYLQLCSHLFHLLKTLRAWYYARDDNNTNK